MSMVKPGVWRSSLWALGIFAILTLVFAHPVVFHVADSIANYGDPLLNTWILAWDAHQLVRDPLELFNANNFYPYPATLAYSENLLGIALLAAPIVLGTGNPVLAHNLAVLASFLLSGLGAYLLARYLTGSRRAALIAGIIFAFAAYRLNGISQLQNLTIQWLPFAFLYLTRSFRTSRTRDLCLFALFFVLQILSCVYYAFYATFAVGLYLAFQLWYAWRDARIGREVGVWARLAVALFLVMALLAVLFRPYLEARSMVGERGFGEQEGASLRDYFTVSPRSVPGRLMPFLLPASDHSWMLFPGFIPLGLAALGTASAFSRRTEGRHSWTKRSRTVDPRREVLFYLSLGLAGFLLSLGTALRLTPDGPILLQPLPYALLHRWIPGLNAMRVPARLVVLVVFSLSVLAAYGSVRLIRTRAAWLAAVAVLLLIEMTVVPSANRPIEVGAQIPEVYRWLSDTAEGSVILELPSVGSTSYSEDTTSMERLSRQQYFSAYHWRPSIMGYSGFVPPLFRDTLDRIFHFPSTEALSFLRGMGVDFVILHRAEFDPGAWSDLEARLRLFAGDLVLAWQSGDDLVYRLERDTAQPLAPRLSLYLPDQVGAGREYVAFGIADNENDHALVHLKPPRYVLAYDWQAADGQTLQGASEGYLPISTPEGTSTMPFHIPILPDGEGILKLQLSVLGRTVAAEQAVRVVEPGNAATALPPEDARRPFFAPDLNFGDRLHLSHVALDSQRYRAGDSLGFTYFVQRSPEESLDDVVIFFKLLEAESGEIVLEDDMLPPRPDFWDASGRAADHRLQQLPLDLAPGRYRLLLGLYDYEREAFVPVIEEDGTATWRAFEAEIEVEDPGAAAGWSKDLFEYQRAGLPRPEPGGVGAASANARLGPKS